MQRAIERQGTGDGLCGVYSLFNYLKQDSLFSRKDEYSPFWYLLEAMQTEGLLQPHYLFDGLETRHLRALLDQVCRRLDLPYEGQMMRPALKARKIRHLIDLSPDFFTEGGGAIVGFKGINHWFLIYGRTRSKFLVADSGAHDRKQINMNQASEIDPDGLLITKRGSTFGNA